MTADPTTGRTPTELAVGRPAHVPDAPTPDAPTPDAPTPDAPTHERLRAETATDDDVAKVTGGGAR